MTKPHTSVSVSKARVPTRDTRHATRDTRHVTRDSRHATLTRKATSCNAILMNNNNTNNTNNNGGRRKVATRLATSWLTYSGWAAVQAHTRRERGLEAV